MVFKTVHSKFESLMLCLYCCSK